MLLPRSLRRKQRGFIIDPFRFGGGATDPYFSFVKQLTHFNGSHGGITYTQTVGPTTFTNGASGSASLTTANPKFGPSSLDVAGGIGGRGVKATSNAAYAIGTSDLTLEFWFYVTTMNGPVLYDGRGGLNGAYMQIGTDGAGRIAPFVNSANPVVFGPGVFTSGAWYYFCWSRTGTTSAFYLGTAGTAARLGTWTDSVNYLGRDIYLGSGSFAGNTSLTGQMDEFRLTIGTDRGYTGASIPVPTAAFPDS